MARMQDLALSRKDHYIVDPSIIQEEPGWNVRPESPDLAAHIRLAAVRMLLAKGVEIKGVPIRIEEKRSSEADRTLSLITHNSGKPLSALELAEVFHRLLGFGWEVPQIAAKAGFSVSHVDNLLRLRTAPAEVLASVKAGEISATLAGEMLRSDPEQVVPALHEAKEAATTAGSARITRKHLGAPERLLGFAVALRRFAKGASGPGLTPVKLNKALEKLDMSKTDSSECLRMAELLRTAADHFESLA